MQWAKDQLGNLVNASERRQFRFGFVCPTCGERVRLRAGLANRPHFAHYSHSPKPDCGHYHPSIRDGSRGGVTFASDENQRPKRLDAHGGVFIERGAGGRFSIYLKLPRTDVSFQSEGTIRVQSGLGEKKYSAEQLRRPGNFVRIVPRVPLVSVEQVGDMWPVVAAIQDDASEFCSSWNMFRGATDTGRLLARSDPLEWGGAYWMLTQERLYSRPDFLRCDLISNFSSGGWLLYKVTLPAEEAILGSKSSIEISAFVGRAIYSPRPHAFVIYPLSHHIDHDGSLIYPTSVEEIRVRRSPNSNIEFSGPFVPKDFQLEETDPEYASMVGLSEGEVEIYCESVFQFAMRIEPTLLFRPSGIQVFVGDMDFELFDARLKTILAEHISIPVTLSAPTSRIADLISLDKNSWVRTNTQYASTISTLKPSIGAGNFGEIVWRQLSLDSEAERSLAIETNEHDARAWVEGLICRLAGPSTLRQVQACWEGGRKTLPGIFDSKYAWLRPYIDAVRAHSGEAQ
jgi:hypothetical protein